MSNPNQIIKFYSSFPFKKIYYKRKRSFFFFVYHDPFFFSFIPALHTFRMTNEKETPSLPTLDDVLHRRSQPPVCLYNYYIVLRDRLHLEQLLDFWLDVAQADIMYKRYLKYAARPSVHHGSNQPFSLPSKVLSQDDLFTHMLLSHPRTSFATTTTSTATVAKKSHPPPPTQSEMSDMLERIYLRYIVSDAEKELLLPHRIREEIAKHFTNKKPISTIPFKDAKQYVREELQHTFGIFLKYKGYMNLTWMQQVGRLVAGLIVLLVGFSYEFSMIFLDVKPWQTRLWVKK